MSTPQTAPAQGSQTDWELLKAVGMLVGLLAVGPLTVTATVGLVGCFQRWRQRWLWLLAAPATAGMALLWPSVHRHLLAALHSMHSHLLRRPTLAFSAAWPHLWPAWIATVFASPLLALAVIYLRPAGMTGDSEIDERRKTDRLEKKVATKAAVVTAIPTDRTGVFLGYRLGGDPLLPTRRGGRVFLPLPRLSHHLLVAGATGSGKTETVLRLAESVAHSTDWKIIYIDGKGDRRNMERFAALMQHHDRTVGLFPDRPHNGWQGTPDEITSRLLQLIDFAQEGGGTYYRDLAINTIRLACVTPTGPPRSSTELLHRLNRDALLQLHTPRTPQVTDITALTRDQLGGIRARYSAFFGTTGGVLDGTATFDEVDSSYLLLDGLRLKHEAGNLARFLVEDFTQWAVARKPSNQKVLLVVDEFSAIAQAGQGLVDVVERTRSFGVAAVLCPQVAEGMGTPEAAARIIGSAQTILLHQMATPEQFVRAAGTRRYHHTTRQLQGDTLTGMGSTRADEQYRADPNDVRRLKPGQCYAIGTGQAMKIQVSPVAALTDLQSPTVVRTATG